MKKRRGRRRGLSKIAKSGEVKFRREPPRPSREKQLNAGVPTTGSITDSLSPPILALDSYRRRAAALPRWNLARRERDLSLRVFTDSLVYRRHRRETAARWAEIVRFYENIETRIVNRTQVATFCKYTNEMNEKRMNDNNQVLPRVCPKCNQIVETAAVVCAVCGRKMVPVSRIKILGWISLGCGIFLLGLMGWLSVWMYQTISRSGQPGAGIFRGGPEVIGIIVVIFGLVLTFGAFAVATGLWQIVYGRRNKILTFIVLILGIAFIGIGLLTTLTRR